MQSFQEDLRKDIGLIRTQLDKTETSFLKLISSFPRIFFI